ncbi:MAG TPA: GyrI-like domain-containing protein [Jiangellaceae bacterium]|nr:GyrI-like domain-containing protein [Jiangellaceae bacterium]
MTKYDIKSARRELYTASDGFEIVDVPELRFLAVDGRGDPNTAPEFAAAGEALYSTSYTLKFTSKNELGRDFTVAPLEGLWRAADVGSFTRGDKSSWEWTVLVAQPDWVTEAEIERAIDTVRSKKNLRSVDEVRSLLLTEGPSVQILHIGSYDDEGPTLARLHHEYMPAHGLTFNGDHHEIYLSDPRRTAPERLRTILRQPVRPL